MRKIISVLSIILLMMVSLNSMAYATEKEIKEESKKEDYGSLLQDYKILEIKNQSLNDDKTKLETKIKEMEKEIDFLGRIVKQGEAKEVPVLLYHHILPQEDIDTYGWGNNDSVVSLESFQAQMKYLKDNGYYTATLKELEQFIKAERKLPKKTVVITFDDGYLSNVVHAYPIMKEYGFKGSIFVIGDTELRDKAEYNPVTTQRIYIPELEEYKDVFEYGCHTYDYHNMIEGQIMLITLDKESIKADLQKSKDLLGATAIAYPFGKYNQTTIEAVKELGYTSAYTVEPGYVTLDTGIYEIPRFVISPKLTLENFENLINPTNQEI